jgi:hypothetical protein
MPLKSITFFANFTATAIKLKFLSLNSFKLTKVSQVSISWIHKSTISYLNEKIKEKRNRRGNRNKEKNSKTDINLKEKMRSIGKL